MSWIKPELILVFILVLQGVLLFANLGYIPHWSYWDDGVNMEIAWNLINWEMRLYAIIYPFIPHPPLFFAVLGVLLKTFGNELIVLRSLTAAYSLLTMVVLYCIGKRVSGAKLGLTASFFYAVYPENIYWSRLGFANSQLMFLSILALYFFLLSGRFRILSYFTVSLALLTQFTAIALLLSILGLLWIEGNKREFLKALIVSISLPALTYALIYFSHAREALLFDVGYALERFYSNIRTFAFTVGVLVLIFSFRGRLKERVRRYLAVVKVIAVRDITFTFGSYSGWILRRMPFTVLVLINLLLAVRTLMPLSDDLLFRGYDEIFFDYFWIGVVGLFVLGERVTLFFFLPLFLLTIGGVGRTDHMTLPLYPFFCLGLGVLLPRLYEKLFWLFSWNERDINKALFVFVLVYYPLGAVVVYDINSFVYGKGLARGDERILSDIVLFLDKNTEKEDVVLSTSHISRLVKARGAELYQGLAAEGDTISYFGKKLPPSRFLFNSSYKRAKYVVLHEGTLDWLSDNMSKVNVSSELGSWPVVYRRGEFVVYRNPHLQNESAVEDKPRPKG